MNCPYTQKKVIDGKVRFVTRANASATVRTEHIGRLKTLYVYVTNVDIAEEYANFPLTITPDPDFSIPTDTQRDQLHVVTVGDAPDCPPHRIIVDVDDATGGED